MGEQAMNVRENDMALVIIDPQNDVLGEHGKNWAIRRSRPTRPRSACRASRGVSDISGPLA
jgi:hypothetical protein